MSNFILKTRFLLGVSGSVLTISIFWIMCHVSYKTVLKKNVLPTGTDPPIKFQLALFIKSSSKLVQIVPRVKT